MLEDYTKPNVNTSFAEKEAYFSSVISSHRTVATITYKSVIKLSLNWNTVHNHKLVDAFIDKIKVELKYSPYNWLFLFILVPTYNSPHSYEKMFTKMVLDACLSRLRQY